MFSACCCAGAGDRVLESSSTAKNTFNPIRSIVDQCKVKPNPSKPLISLSLGDPTAFGTMKTAASVTAAVSQALADGQANGYAAAVGSEKARQAIAERYSAKFNVRYTGDDVFIASGCSGALELAITVLCSPKESAILVPRPGFTLYATLAASKSIESVHYPLDPNKSWHIDLQATEELLRKDRGRRIRAWVINNPSNPCGSVYPRDHLIECLKLAKKYKVPIIADEVYEDMVFAGHEYIPLAQLSQQSPAELNIPILTCSGLGKRFLVPGWRFGWIGVHEAPGWDLSMIRKGLFDLSTLIIGSNTLVQWALPEIFANTEDGFFKRINKQLEINAAVVADRLCQIPQLTVKRPQGTMYMLVGFDFTRFKDLQTDVQVYEALLQEESVVVLPGSIFGAKGYVRVVFCASEEHLLEACNRIQQFCRRHQLS